MTNYIQNNFSIEKYKQAKILPKFSYIEWNA